MFAFPKLVLLILLIVAVWYVFRWVNPPPRGVQRRRPAAARPVHPALEAEELSACAVCGAYVALGARSCGRADCPRPR